MKILLVMDQFDDANNGTTISARRFAQALAQSGNEVRVVACGEPSEEKYALKRLHFLPLADRLIRSQGMQFAIPSRRVFEEAIKWADVVHFMMPFWTSTVGLQIAEKYHVPHTAAFHCQPENITFSIGLGNNKSVNDMLYNWFRDHFYSRFTHIHCPSRFIADQLKEHGYTAKLHVISNGIAPEFRYCKRDKEPWLSGKFVILMIGRYSGEKRQDVLIDAAAKSRYADQIQLILAGQGPLEKKLKKLGQKLPNTPIFAFYTPERLREIIAMGDLYVHTSDAEIEAISCIEAFASGLVPIIADSARSATPQFAMDERSLFAAGDSDALAQRIDWWIEHPEQRREMELAYAHHAENYTLSHSVELAEQMFRTAIEEQGSDV